MEKSILLLSGGLDSVVNFKMALDSTDIRLLLTFDYGQESAPKEVETTRLLAAHYKIPHRVMRLDYLSELDDGLTKGNIPDYEASKLDNLEYALKTAKAVWVPNRNGLFINIAAAFADKEDIGLIITGFNKEEAATFPDNSSEFIDAINKSLSFSTQSKTRVKSYTINMDKAGIVRMGMSNNAPLEYIWSCYHNYDKMCGKCESCQRLLRAFKADGNLDEFLRRNKWGIL